MRRGRTLPSPRTVRRGRALGLRRVVAGLALVAGALASSREARAESIIKSPGDHPPYRVELEPHGLIGYGGPFLRGRGTLGAGFRATFIIVENGFVKQINNSVGIGVGGDVFFHRDATLYVPVVMQWNFFFTEHWSAFAKPGVGVAVNGRDYIHPNLSLGGRYFFNDKVSLTMRIGYPAFAIGASFFL